jgi:hypothetical protein
MRGPRRGAELGLLNAPAVTAGDGEWAHAGLLGRATRAAHRTQGRVDLVRVRMGRRCRRARPSVFIRLTRRRHGFRATGVFLSPLLGFVFGCCLQS